VTPRTLVLGDLHLVRGSPASLVSDVARFVRDHRGARIVSAGDLFDLSADFPGAPKPRALASAFAQHEEVRASLREHVDRDGQLWFVSGNHDAAIGDGADGIADALGLVGEARTRIRVTPWFFREGGLHLEHGHLYDPDNATTHPLVVNTRSLGVHFVEEFLAPTGAFHYLNANDGTPLELFVSAFTRYGLRAPYVVFKYFDTAFRVLGQSGPFYRGTAEAVTGKDREDDFAREHDVSMALIDTMLELKRDPTMSSTVGTFQRLYLDRVFATVALAGGLGGLLARRDRLAFTCLAVGATIMGASWALGYDRYRGTVPELLASSADAVARATGARLVVFGHAHREALHGSYANTGSFAFPQGAPGRPYLEIEGDRERPVAVRRYLYAPA
jgi:hypothetical protein